ncbi:MAG: TIGR02450 family Trp-rich protein [Lentisphaerales bacterium]|nr:TIGR02450 family Trp-rich protein [Lentisphaerales bacterium]
MDTKNIISSKWTSQQVENKRKHFEVVSFNNKEKSVYLKPILKGKSQLATLEELSNTDLWRSGWN